MVTKLEKLRKTLEERNEKISKAERVKSLIQKQKKLIKSRQSLTDFQEPVLFLIRRDGRMELHEKATAGKYTFEHSCGEARYIELRPEDQVTFEYAGRRVRSYVAHEDRPFAGFENPIVDSETVMLGYEKTKATDLKYQERIQNLKNKGKMTWVWIIIGLAIAGFILAMAYSSYIAPALSRREQDQAALAAANSLPPLAGLLLIKIKGGLKWSIRRRKRNALR